MNSTNVKHWFFLYNGVWEICKFWILQTPQSFSRFPAKFERYVNFEFYKRVIELDLINTEFERYVNFEFYKRLGFLAEMNKVWEICKFWILQISATMFVWSDKFERYVNFEFYKIRKRSIWWITRFERYVNFEFYKQPKRRYLYFLSLRDM